MAAADRGYQSFAAQPEYIELNRCFVRSLVRHLTQCRVIVDVACGVGTLSLLLLEELQRRGERRSQILGIDLSRESLSLAREALGARRLQASVVEGSGDRLAVRSGTADAVLLGNAIHLFLDKPRLVAEAARTLRPGGVFAFNTRFYEGGDAEASERFTAEWSRQALRYAKQRGVRDPARRHGAAAAFANPWLLPAEYRDLVESARFRVASVEERAVELSSSSFEAIGAYAEFASMQLPGYSLDLAREALVSTVAPALRALGLTGVTRSWLELIAVKQ